MPKQITGRQQDFSFYIKSHMGILGTSQSGWTKEINLVEWNGNPAKLDIRDWDAAHEHMSRGITLHRDETLVLLEVLLKNYGREFIKSRLSLAKEAADVCKMVEDQQLAQSGEEEPAGEPEQSAGNPGETEF